ncbi:MAG: hypothetical protein DSM107014_09590 [Gomphosphaeria aponina SAG 52.96 = DSM 107014]|uniref:Uncharacterized protein n=1 Tax=Gomphosphaeria aponina SAG 52.96 = DSM 107014 TaxID=1521640 RepID=A0A941JT79_9CHRO|nr:hypothetical protein [Gomphosphaeria aponina SAG 52.96 = DSM 107014]
MIKNTQSAEFVERSKCINSGSTNLKELSSGFFTEQPLKNFIDNEPWGESPLKYLTYQKWCFVQCLNCTQKFHKYILNPSWMKKCYSEWVTQKAIEKFEKDRGLNSAENLFEKGRHYIIYILCIKNSTTKN